MDVARTIKARLVLDDEDDYRKVDETMEAFRDGCNRVSRYIFDNDFPLNQISVQEVIYQELRTECSLKSMMAQSAIRATIARYKAVRTQLGKQEVWDGYKKDEDGDDVKNTIPKDLTFLWKPIEFKRPQLDLVRNRDYSIKHDQTVSLNTIHGRVHGRLILNGFEGYLDPSKWRFGTAKIVKRGKHYFMHISVAGVVDDVEVTSIEKVVGIDRGLRQVVTTYDDEGTTTFVNGAAIGRKRRHYKNLRASLQRTGTQSAKRRLRKLSGRENRWMSDVNHCLSKTLVEQHGPNTLFVLEDLTNVTFATVNNRRKEDRYEHHSWSFYDLEQKLSYKAAMNGSRVITVPADYTSQRCCKCGTIRKANRLNEIHLYACNRCGYRTNDDRNAAMNIHDLGRRYLNGVKRPSFRVAERE